MNKIPIVIGFCCLLLWAVPARASDVLDDLTTTGLVDKKEEKNSALCQRALYSKSFDQWCKFYLAGKDAEAEKEWAKILPMVKDATSLRQLIRGANTRLQFMEGDERTQLLERGDAFCADNKMLAATEKVLGRNNEQVASIYAYISNCYMDVRNYPKATEYQLVVYQIREKKMGKSNVKLAEDIREMAHKSFLSGQYNLCKPYAQRMVDLGTQYRERLFIREGNSYLTRIKEKTAGAKKGASAAKTSSKSPKSSNATFDTNASFGSNSSYGSSVPPGLETSKTGTGKSNKP